MASQGPLGAGVGANIEQGDIDWATPENITATDDAHATAALNLDTQSDFLEASSFGFTIADGSTIDGIVVEIERSKSGIGIIEDLSVFIVKDGGAAGSEHAIAGAWPGTDTYQTYGSSSDLWSTTWTPAQIGAAGFGIRLKVYETGGANSATARVDFIRITVYYTPPAGVRSFAVGFIGA